MIRRVAMHASLLFSVRLSEPCSPEASRGNRRCH